MASKKNNDQASAVALPGNSKSDNVAHLPEGHGGLQITDEVLRFAAGLGVELTGTLDERADRAAEHMNRSQRHMLASGLLLASIKDACGHGEFLALIEERGFEHRAAQRAMQYAQFIISRPEDERQLLIGLPKSKVLALASADAQVIEAVLADDGETSIDALSVRALQDRIRELEAAAVDDNVQLQTAEADAAALREQLSEGRAKRKDKVPHVVADLRAEIAEHTRAAQLALGEFQPLGVEADAAQERFAVLIGAHTYSKDLRQWEREQARPRGKGRPAAKPEAPKGGA